MQQVRGLFQQRVPGDDALLRLARLRFEQAGLGAEVYAADFAALDRMLAFAPADDVLPMVHLDRRLDLMVDDDRRRVAGFVERFRGRIAGVVVHDKAPMVHRTDDVEAACRQLDGDLRADSPMVFLEYAAGHPPDWFAGLAERVSDVAAVSMCVDIGHVGIHQAHRALAQSRRDVTFTRLQADADLLATHIDAVEMAVDTALPTVLRLTDRLARVGKPLHFHLHDGHPLIPTLSDHFGFLTQVPVPFAHRGRRAVDTMYGPDGLRAIVATAVAAAPHDAQPSLTLEIHQVSGRQPLADAAPLFAHWTDLTNAEHTDRWLSVLAENARLVSDGATER